MFKNCWNPLETAIRDFLFGGGEDEFRFDFHLGHCTFRLLFRCQQCRGTVGRAAALFAQFATRPSPLFWAWICFFCKKVAKTPQWTTFLIVTRQCRNVVWAIIFSHVLFHLTFFPSPIPPNYIVHDPHDIMAFTNWQLGSPDLGRLSANMKE